jgi:hypothetical protein
LAFIPTVVALTSNSIDEVVLVAEESPLLALCLCLCSVTVFTSRFGAGGEGNQESDAGIREDIEFVVKSALSVDPYCARTRKRQRVLILVAEIAILFGCCIATWIPTRMIWRDGVVVYSCEQRVYVPIWIALFQLLAAANVLLAFLT